MIIEAALAGAVASAEPSIATRLAQEAPAVAVLRGLDKYSGRVIAFEAPVGGSARFERLTVSVEACEAVAGGDGVAAWIAVVDDRAPDAPAFEGWMFSASPAIAALDHPRYDVWIASCGAQPGESG